jgi:hypothetical protein
MPVAYVDIPTGVNDGARKKIFQELYAEIHEAWPIPDTRVLIREWPNGTVSQDGRIENVPMRPICTLAVPPGLEHDAKQRLVRQISNKIGEACRTGREPPDSTTPTAGFHSRPSAPAGAADSSHYPRRPAAQNIPFRCHPAGQPGHGSAAPNG